MIAADVPLWFAGLGLVIPVLGSLLTLIIVNRNAADAFKREMAERAAIRTHDVRSETWRSDRADRTELHRKLIVAARRLLGVERPMVEELLRMQDAISNGRQYTSGPMIGDIDMWHNLATETELLAPRVVPAANAVTEHYNETFAERFKELGAREGPGYVHDLDARLQEDERSKDLIKALIKACSDDVHSMSEVE